MPDGIIMLQLEPLASNPVLSVLPALKTLQISPARAPRAPKLLNVPGATQLN